MRNNHILGFILAFLVYSTFAYTQNNIGSFNANWRFTQLDSSINQQSFEHPNYDDSHWESVRLPHTANIEPLTVNNQWQGICWYRKTFTIPQNKLNKKVFLEFEAAMNYSKIWVNGKLVKEHNGGYLPVVLDVTGHILQGKENIVALRLDNTDNQVTGPKPLKRLDFNMYGGLYRKASITYKDNIYITHPAIANKVGGGGIFITYPKVSKKKSIVNIKTQIANEYLTNKLVELTHKVYQNGKLISELKIPNINIGPEKGIEISKEIPIKNPHLWSPEHPNLYLLETEVLVDGNLIDQQINRFGIREFNFQDNNLFINGEKTFLRGVNRHQEYPFIGYALSDNAQYRDAKKIKDAGFNYIRLSHYPQSPAFMNACDELGLVVIDAIMGWQYYNDTAEFRNYCYQSATQLIRRDRNHPSVLAWEVSLNETQMPVFFMKELDKIVHQEYPGEHVFSCGWKDDVYDIYLQARQHRILHPKKLKDKPYSVSEYGDWEYYSKNAGLNQDQLPNDLRDELSSRQARGYGEERLHRQSYNVQEAHNDNLNTMAYSDSYWVMYDYNRGYHNDIERSGLMDIFRLPKFAYYFYKSQKEPSTEVVLNIASYWNEKSSKSVKIYSNCDMVKLYLNDKLISSQSPDSDKNTTNLAHPPFTFNLEAFERGTLKAIGYIDNKKVAESSVSTPEKASSLKLWIDESGKAAKSQVNDVLFLYIAAIDSNGTINPDFSGKISILTDSDVSILNIGEIRAEAGIATVVMKIGSKKGKVQITATSSGLIQNFEFDVE